MRRTFGEGAQCQLCETGDVKRLLSTGAPSIDGCDILDKRCVGEFHELRDFSILEKKRVEDIGSKNFVPRIKPDFDARMNGGGLAVDGHADNFAVDKIEVLDELSHGCSNVLMTLHGPRDGKHSLRSCEFEHGIGMKG